MEKTYNLNKTAEHPLYCLPKSISLHAAHQFLVKNHQKKANGMKIIPFASSLLL